MFVCTCVFTCLTMFMYVCVHILVRSHTCECIHTSVCVHIFACKCVDGDEFTYMFLSEFKFFYVRVCLHLSVFV